MRGLWPSFHTRAFCFCCSSLLPLFQDLPVCDHIWWIGQRFVGRLHWHVHFPSCGGQPQDGLRAVHLVCRPVNIQTNHHARVNYSSTFSLYSLLHHLICLHTVAFMPSVYVLSNNTKSLLTIVSLDMSLTSFRSFFSVQDVDFSVFLLGYPRQLVRLDLRWDGMLLTGSYHFVSTLFWPIVIIAIVANGTKMP